MLSSMPDAVLQARAKSVVQGCFGSLERIQGRRAHYPDETSADDEKRIGGQGRGGATGPTWTAQNHTAINARHGGGTYTTTDGEQGDFSPASVRKKKPARGSSSFSSSSSSSSSRSSPSLLFLNLTRLPLGHLSVFPRKLFV